MKVERTTDLQPYEPRLPGQRALGRLYVQPTPSAAWAERFNRYASRLGDGAPVVWRDADFIEIMSAAKVPAAVARVDGLIRVVNADHSR